MMTSRSIDGGKLKCYYPYTILLLSAQKIVSHFSTHLSWCTDDDDDDDVPACPKSSQVT